MIGVQSADAYKKLAANVELLNEYFDIFMWISIIFMSLGCIPFTFIRMYVFNMGDESYYLLVHTWFVFIFYYFIEIPMKKLTKVRKFRSVWFFGTRYPFDQKTPLGHLLTCVFQFIGIYAVAQNMVQTLNLFFGSCWLFNFMGEDITKDLSAFNRTVQQQSSEGNRTMVLTKRFCDLVKIHSDAK